MMPEMDGYQLLEVLEQKNIPAIFVTDKCVRQETLTIDDVKVDCSSRTVYKEDQRVTLTPKEYELLEFLLTNANIAFSRESLLNQVWGYDYFGSTRTVDTHILNLRTKLLIKIART